MTMECPKNTKLFYSIILAVILYVGYIIVWANLTSSIDYSVPIEPLTYTIIIGALFRHIMTVLVIFAVIYSIIVCCSFLRGKLQFILGEDENEHF